VKGQDVCLVDVIVPFKDNIEHLKSIEYWMRRTENLAQFRIILVHDTIVKNNCESYIHEMESRFEKSKFTLLRGVFGSPGAARNAGLDQVAAEWVAFWDSDDVPNTETFLDMILLGKKSGAKVCIGSYEVNQTTRKREVKRRIASRPLYVALSPGIWRMAFESSLLQGTKFSKSLWGEDQRFLFEINYLSHPTLYYENSVYTYYQGSEDQLTRQKQNSTYLVDELSYCLSIVSNKRVIREIFFYTIMSTRMMVTLVKYGELREIRQSLARFIRVYVQSPKRLVVGLIPSVTLILMLIPLQAIGRKI